MLRRITFALLLTFAFAFSAAARERVLLGVEGKGFLEAIDGQLVLHISGTPKEMGTQHGRLLAPKVKEDIRAYLDDFALGDAKKTRAELMGLWRKHLPSIPAAYVEELEAMADAAGVGRDDVFAAHAIPTVFHCSGAALSGPATKDGKLYHYRSLDYSLGIGHAKKVQENAVLFVRAPDGAIPHVVVGWAGVVGCVTGMSAAGVSLGEMGSSSRDEEPGAGTPMMIHMLRVLAEAKSGEDAVAQFKAWKRGEGYNFIVGDGKSGKAWAIEVSKSRFAAFGMGDPAEDVAPHYAIEHCVRRVNHFVSRELAEGQRRIYDPRLSEPASWIGYDLISKFVKENFGRFDGEKMIALCRSYPPEHECLHQAVMSPGDGRIWVANAVAPGEGRLAGAQNQTFHAYRLQELLETRPEGLAPGATSTSTSASTSTRGTARATRLDLRGVEDERLRADLAAFEGPEVGAFEWSMRPVRGATVGGEVFDLTFPSPIASKVPENDTVYCRYFAPQNVPPGARVPAAIILHHLGGSFAIEAALADYLAKAGVAALQVEFPYYGPRRPKDLKGFEPGLISANFDDGVAATRQAVADVRRAADWLVGRPEIDAARVGIVGISLGGIAGSLAAGVDPRLRRNVFVIAGGDLPSILLNESRETRRLREVLKERGVGREALERGIGPVDPLRFAGRINTAGTLMINAKRDEVIPRASTDQLWEAAHKPEIVWYETGHVTVAAYIMDILARTRAHFLKPEGEAQAKPVEPEVF